MSTYDPKEYAPGEIIIIFSYGTSSWHLKTYTGARVERVTPSDQLVARTESGTEYRFNHKGRAQGERNVFVESKAAAAERVNELREEERVRTLKRELTAQLDRLAGFDPVRQAEELIAGLQDAIKMIRPDLPSYKEVVCAFCDVLDGTQNHDLHCMTGLPEERCEEVARTRAAVTDIWLKEAE